MRVIVDAAEHVSEASLPLYPAEPGGRGQLNECPAAVEEMLPLIRFYLRRFPNA